MTEAARDTLKAELGDLKNKIFEQQEPIIHLPEALVVRTHAFFMGKRKEISCNSILCGSSEIEDEDQAVT